MGHRLRFGRGSLAGLVAAGIFAAAPACPVAGADPVRPAGSGIYIIPSRMCGSVFLVPLTLNAGPEGVRRELTFLFDSGTRVTWIDPDAIGWLPGRTVKAGDRISLTDVQAGPLTFRRLTAGARQLDHLAEELGESFDGVLGFSAFRDFLLTADYPNGQLRISRGTLPPADGREVFDANGPDGRPYLDVRFGKRTHRVLIDTGSSSTFTLHRHDSMRWRTAPAPVEAFMHMNRLEMRKAGRLAGEARAGEHRIRQPLVYLTADETETMGANALRHFTVTFDQRYNRVRLRRGERSVIEMPPLRDTGAMLRATHNGLQVLTVLKGSPAEEAGLRAGDLIVAVNGKNALRRGCPAPGDAAADAQITYEVKRGRNTVPVTVRRDVLVP